jgi:hypothetical protein
MMAAALIPTTISTMPTTVTHSMVRDSRVSLAAALNSGR